MHLNDETVFASLFVFMARDGSISRPPRIIQANPLEQEGIIYHRETWQRQSFC